MFPANTNITLLRNIDKTLLKRKKNTYNFLKCYQFLYKRPYVGSPESDVLIQIHVALNCNRKT